MSPQSLSPQPRADEDSYAHFRTAPIMSTAPFCPLKLGTSIPDRRRNDRPIHGDDRRRRTDRRPTDRPTSGSPAANDDDDRSTDRCPDRPTTTTTDRPTGRPTDGPTPGATCAAPHVCRAFCIVHDRTPGPDARRAPFSPRILHRRRQGSPRGPHELTSGPQ